MNPLVVAIKDRSATQSWFGRTAQCPFARLGKIGSLCALSVVAMKRRLDLQVISHNCFVRREAAHFSGAIRAPGIGRGISDSARLILDRLELIRRVRQLLEPPFARSRSCAHAARCLFARSRNGSTDEGTIAGWKAFNSLRGSFC
jgi:hypothetical protein